MRACATRSHLFGRSSQSIEVGRGIGSHRADLGKSHRGCRALEGSRLPLGAKENTDHPENTEAVGQVGTEHLEWGRSG